MMIDLDDITFNKTEITPNTVIHIILKNNPTAKVIDQAAEKLHSHFPDNVVLVSNENEMTMVLFEKTSKEDE